MMPDNPLDPRFRARLRAELVARVRAGGTAVAARRRRRRRVGGAAVIGLAAASVGVIAVFGPQWLPAPTPAATDAAPMTVLCAGAVLMPDAAQPLNGIELTLDTGNDPAASAVAACSALWQAGELQSAVELQVGDVATPEVDSATGGALSDMRIPPLSLCTLSDGTKAVVPFSSCGELEELLKAR